MTFCLIVLVFSCQKNDNDGCLGCGIDTSPKEFEFEINGNIYANCQGEGASLKTLEFLISNEDNTFLGTTLSDSNGNFNFTYQVILDYPYHTYHSFGLFTPSLTILKVEEDSIEFILPGLLNMENVNLNLDDSIRLDIFLDYNNKPLLSTDTIYYTFKPKGLSGEYSSYQFKAGGPKPNHELINHVNSKWKTVEVDEYGNPVLNVYWRVRRPTDSFEPNWFTSKTTKSTCVMKNDSVSITLE